MSKDTAPIVVERVPKRIAIVDDDRSVRSAMNSLVQSLGYAGQAFSGGRALLTVGVQNFDLILSDLQMPQMSGLELLAEVRDVAPQLPFLMMTADPEVHVRRRALALGVQAFLEKPCNIETLVHLIEEAIGLPEEWI